jgi:hypothetical protein
MDTRRFALVWGIGFLLFGVLGFVPGITAMHTEDHPNLIVEGPGDGALLGLFHVNVLHNIIHLLYGVMGLTMCRTLPSARRYAQIVGVSYLLLAVLGLIPFANINNTFGLVPIHGHDVWLHLLLGLPAAYFGFAHRDKVRTDEGYTTTTTSGV